MNDDKLLEKIKRSADSCDVPEGLKPEMLDFVRPSEQGIRDRKIRRASAVLQRQRLLLCCC